MLFIWSQQDEIQCKGSWVRSCSGNSGMEICIGHNNSFKNQFICKRCQFVAFPFLQDNLMEMSHMAAWMAQTQTALCHFVFMQHLKLLTCKRENRWWRNGTKWSKIQQVSVSKVQSSTFPWIFASNSKVLGDYDSPFRHAFVFLFFWKKILPSLKLLALRTTFLCKKTILADCQQKVDF